MAVRPLSDAVISTCRTLPTQQSQGVRSQTCWAGRHATRPAQETPPWCTRAMRGHRRSECHGPAPWVDRLPWTGIIGTGWLSGSCGPCEPRLHDGPRTTSTRGEDYAEVGVAEDT